MKVNMQGLTSVPYPLSVKASISTLRDCATSVGALSHSSPRFEWFANTSQQIHAIPHIRIPILWILQICHGSSYDSVTLTCLASKCLTKSSRSVTKVLATSLLYFHQAPSTGLTLKSRKTSTCSDHCGQCDFIRQILTLTVFWIQSLSSTGCLFLSLANKMYVSYVCGAREWSKSIELRLDSQRGGCSSRSCGVKWSNTVAGTVQQV